MRSEPNLRCLITELDFDDVDLAADAAALIAELREGLTADDALSFLQSARSEGYRVLVARLSDRDAVHSTGLAGFRVLSTSRGRILMLDDLVVSQPWRARGIGADLLTHLRQYATSEGCGRIELDTGVTNKRAQHVYGAAGFAVVALHFAMPVPAPPRKAGSGCPTEEGSDY